MTTKRIQWSITIGALIVAIVHLVFPSLNIDAITVTLVLVAVVPWLAPLFKSLELPGGVKLEFQDLQDSKQRAEKAGLLSAEAQLPATREYSFQLVADEDANLALAGLRIEIENRLVEIAQSHGLPGERQSVRRLLQMLVDRDLLNYEERGVLSDMIGLLNSAVHGASVDVGAADWAIQVGPRLLKSLDERIKPQ